MKSRPRMTRATTYGWAIAILQGEGRRRRRAFLGRYWRNDLPIPVNFGGYRQAVFNTRREARALLATVRVPYGFPDARVVRVAVTVRNA